MAGLAERIAGLAAGPRPRHRIRAFQKPLLEEGPNAVLIFYNEYFRRRPPALSYRVLARGSHTGPGKPRLTRSSRGSQLRDAPRAAAAAMI